MFRTNDQIILFGAGATGRHTLHKLISDGRNVVAFADNSSSKQGQHLEGIAIFGPDRCRELFPMASWVATAMYPPQAKQIRDQIASMKVASIPLYECFPVQHGLPTDEVAIGIGRLVKHDSVSFQYFFDQLGFRATPNYDTQLPPSPIEEIYFPPFISHRDDEHFVDAGAADGDTIGQFIMLHQSWKKITAIEPDKANYAEIVRKISTNTLHEGVEIKPINVALGDCDQFVSFDSAGEQYSAISSKGKSIIRQRKLDDIITSPTYIKMDIEGSELAALWGAHRLIAQHSPVLAICAYHKSEDLWQIPMMINMIQPNYKLFFRRYAEDAFETVWYAVPPERIIAQ